MSSLANNIVDALRSVFPNKQEAIPLHAPVFKGNEWNYVKECMDTSWVSSVGKYVDRFEQELAEYVGVRRAVAVVNGTAALHIALKLVGVQEGDEVLLPTLTFVATANAVSYCNAIPHFVDSEEQSLGLDPYKLKDYLKDIAFVKGNECFNRDTGRRIKAVIPMHTFGHPVDLDPLIELCAKYHIEVVEDAAESLGSCYKGQHTGSFGKISALSFNGNKIITTGGGGAILTNDEWLADQAKHLTTTAKVPHAWEYEHDQVGYNYRLPNMNAALGCAQLEQLSTFIANKQRLTQKYVEVFKDIEGVHIFVQPPFAKSNYWLQVLVLNDRYSSERDGILEQLNKNAFVSRPLWKPMHTLKMHKDCPRMDVSCAERLAKRVINIPSNVQLSL